MTLQTDISEAIKALINASLSNKYNISLGFFQGYATVDADSSGLRFCDLKLHYKTDNNEDINALQVPLLYLGTTNYVTDFKLVSGAELMVFFTDRSLEQWITSTDPQNVKNPVRDSINHAFAVPVHTHHSDDLMTQKLDLLNIIDRLFGVLLGDKGSLDLTGAASTGTISQAGAINEITALRNALAPVLN